MSRICLFVLFLTLGIAVCFGENENTKDNVDCTPEKPGSDKTRLSPFEKLEKRRNSLPDAKYLAKMHTKNIIKSSERNSDTSQGSVSDFITKNYGPLFPGTKWCGNGDDAKDYNDLGFFNNTDACCRAHDNCKSDLSAGATKANLINNGLFTRSACTCDEAFLDCLEKVRSPTSKIIGEIYFNILEPQCYTCICPTDDCQYGNTDDPNCDNHCTKYKWVDNPKF
ncbi:phospholipase A2-like [Anoplolepis gracilipes]|uniref:phospholipase A2-like n=1 Tax=Anoplolepis gracilipes TaxID=354296 RepID=UPI003BA232DC